MGLSLTACSEDDLDTNQYQQGVHLNVYGCSISLDMVRSL